MGSPDISSMASLSNCLDGIPSYFLVNYIIMEFVAKSHVFLKSMPYGIPPYPLPEYLDISSVVIIVVVT